MTISPEALEKARSLVANYGSDPDGLLVGAIAAALQAERDAAAPKLPDDLAGLVERLNGVYRVPITDGLGAVGSGEEPDNPNEFVRRFETPPIQKEAAAAIQPLVARIAELEAGLKDTAEALRSRLTADELNAPHHKPYEHPLSAYDRAARLLNKDRQP